MVLDQLLQFDRVLFDFVNQSMAHPVLDVILPIMRHKETWIPVYLACILWIIYCNRSRAWIPLLAIGLTMTVSDTLSSKLIKKSVKRSRPCHIVEEHPQTIVRVRCGGGYSFTSSHATNHFTLAWLLPVLLGFRQRWFKWLCLFWAGLISISQVYVGVHYPIDIFCGALLGSLLGLGVLRIYSKYGLTRLNRAVVVKA